MAKIKMNSQIYLFHILIQATKILKKNIRKERINIFTSEIQKKKLEKITQIFMDETFSSWLKNFYQFFNIITDIVAGKYTFPIAHILMYYKSAYSYKYIFNCLNIFIQSMKIVFDLTKIL